VTDVQTFFLQLFSHPGPPVGFQTQAVLFTDMSQDHHIITLSLAHRAHTPRAKTT
jgi:hypothetical protein